MKITKELIQAELRRLAVDGVRPSQRQFTTATGIKEHQWGVYGTLSELAEEVGLNSPSMVTKKHDPSKLLDLLVLYIKRHHEFPAQRIWNRRREGLDLPNWKAIESNLGSKKSDIARRLVEHCQKQGGLDDVIAIAIPICEQGMTFHTKATPVGEVYLFKAGRNYTIGKADNAVIRQYQHQRGNAEELKLIATIKSAFPFAVESYWHSRFKKKRIRPSWYKLDKEDVEAFKSATFPE